MKLLDPFEAGCDEEGLKELLFCEPLGGLLSKYKDEVINQIGEDEITKLLIKKMSKDKLMELVDKIGRE